jgi:hypothetical protein
MIDENPGTINDAFFVCDLNQTTTWVDIPAAYHGHGGCFSFADGHSELKVWRDGNVLAAQNKLNATVPIDPNWPADLKWLQERATTFKVPH